MNNLIDIKLIGGAAVNKKEGCADKHHLIYTH